MNIRYPKIYQLKVNGVEYECCCYGTTYRDEHGVYAEFDVHFRLKNHPDGNKCWDERVGHISTTRSASKRPSLRQLRRAIEVRLEQEQYS